MGYAVRIDGQGWRAVNQQKDVGQGENYSDTQPAPIIIAEPALVDPVEKLRQFLAANPDVAAIL